MRLLDRVSAVLVRMCHAVPPLDYLINARYDLFYWPDPACPLEATAEGVLARAPLTSDGFCVIRPCEAQATLPGDTQTCCMQRPACLPICGSDPPSLVWLVAGGVGGEQAGRAAVRSASATCRSASAWCGWRRSGPSRWPWMGPWCSSPPWTPTAARRSCTPPRPTGCPSRSRYYHHYHRQTDRQTLAHSLTD